MSGYIHYNTIEMEEGNGKEIQLSCKECQKETFHEILVSVKQSGSVGESAQLSEQFWEDYRIAQCKGCKEISFLKEWRFTAYTDIDGTLQNNQEIYPSRSAGLKRRIENLLILPKQVRDIYQETFVALSNQQPVLVGVGIRALIESVCKERNAGEKHDNLEKKINKLVEQDVLTEKGAEILHELRFLGNEAAHEVEAYDEQTLSTAMNIAENLLETVYQMPEFLERLRNRKKKP